MKMRACLMMAMMLGLTALPGLAGTISDGLDWYGLTWATGGTPSVSGENVDWSYITDDSYSDGDCVTSGAGGAGWAPSWLKTTIEGPCTVSFWYKFQTYGGSFEVTDNSCYLIDRSGEYTGAANLGPMPSLSWAVERMN